MNNTPLDKITVAIDGEAVTYLVARTTAPRAYDGFGTLTVYQYDAGALWDSDSFRVVLIREEHFAWQNGRYNSGLFYATKPDWPDKDVIAKELWQRLAGSDRNELQHKLDELLAAAKDVSQWAWNTGTHKAWQDRLNSAIANVRENRK